MSFPFLNKNFIPTCFLGALIVKYFILYHRLSNIIAYFMQLILKSIKRRKIYFHNYIHNYLYWQSCFLCGFRLPFGVICFQPEEFSRISCKVDLLATHSLSFCFSGSVLISPSWARDSFVRHKISIHSFLSLAL